MGSHANGFSVGANGPAAAPIGPGGRAHTLSLAVAASCVENAQNLELATLLAGQVARAAAVFRVDEVVVIDDAAGPRVPGRIGAAAALLARVLQYLETPQYLRKALVPMHPQLRFAGALPPLDAPHHLRADEWAPWREGAVRGPAPGGGSAVDVGLARDAVVPGALRPGARVTLRMGGAPPGEGAPLRGELATPAEPRERAGRYWGYTVRVAPSLAAALEECPFPGGYDLTIGTSERGERVPPGALLLPRFRHALVAVGGPEGLERCLRADGAPSDDPAPLFRRYLNTCLHQGSRTIRTEEAVLITMAVLEPALERALGGGAA